MEVLEFADGLLLTAENLPRAVDEVTTEDVINTVMTLAEAEGMKLEDRGRDCGNDTFHIGGTLFSWSEDETEEGEAAVLVESEDEEED